MKNTNELATRTEGDNGKQSGRSPKHTPGPWHVHEGGNHVYVGADGYNEYIAREGYLGGPLCVAEVNYKATEDHSADHDKAMANGRVIAAAPEMLKALKDARLAFCKILTFNLVRDEAKREAISEIRKQLDVAIAKAEGRMS